MPRSASKAGGAGSRSIARRPGRCGCWSADGAVAAWLSFSSFYGRPAYAGTAEVSIYVDQRFRRQRLGAGLLRAAIAHAPAIGVRTLLGFIFGHNLPSLALFEQFGFERWGHLPRVAVLDDVERDVVIVGLRVG